MTISQQYCIVISRKTNTSFESKLELPEIRASDVKRTKKTKRENRIKHGTAHLSSAETLLAEVEELRKYNFEPYFL